MRSTRTMDALKLAMRDSYWLMLREQGRSAEDVAQQFGVSAEHVRRRLALAREAEAAAKAAADEDDARAAKAAVDGPDRGPRPWWVDLVPLFPINPLTPASRCPHNGPIRPGSMLCCMVCNGSGMDHHPAIARDAATATAHLSAAPKAAPKRPSPARASRAKSPAPKPAPPAECRRERRRRTFGDRPAA